MSIRVEKYEVWVTTLLTNDEKDEVSRLLATIAARSGSKYHMGAVAKHTGMTSLDSFSPTILASSLD